MDGFFRTLLSFLVHLSVSFVPVLYHSYQLVNFLNLRFEFIFFRLLIENLLV
jgi:hypothetical protein